MVKMLIVEDDLALCQGILLGLQQPDTEFCQCPDLASAKQAFVQQKPDLIILDYNLPDGSGLDFCRWVRQTSAVPILFLTARDLELDIVSCLESGADDYLTKPFSLAVLRARINALIRRSQKQEPALRVQFADLDLDFANLRFLRQSQELNLSRSEQKLLYLLLKHRGRILSREFLTQGLWGDGQEYVDENALSVTVRRLRSKIEPDPSHPQYIQTVYGVGYVWEER